MTIPEDRRRLGHRLVVLQGGTAVVFAALALSFWFLQVVQHQQYLEMADNQHQRTLALRAPRGVLYDRDGQMLVENRQSYMISIVREHTRDMDRTIRLLSSVAGLDPERVRQTVDRHRNEPAYRPIVVAQDASLAQVAAVIARRLDFELPDVVVEQVPARHYPDDALAAHLFGYVREASATQLTERIGAGAIIGQSGVERVYNDMLMGEDGARLVVVNSMGREIRTLEEVPPTEGQRLQLTIDADVQRAAEEGFRQLGFNGAALILDPRTGEVLSHVSLPAYDPNDFSGRLDPAIWDALNTDPLRPLNNRVIQGRYPPGSTFKIVVAAAALEEGVIDTNTRIRCTGSANFFGRNFRCHLPGGHGAVDVREALEHSCNVFFYTVGNMLGVDRIYRWAERLGLAGRTGIDLPNEQESLVPNTEWKRRTTGEPWWPGETISVSIGQGQVTVTPASLAVMIASVANGGARVTPHVVKAIDEGGGWQPVPPPAVGDPVTFRPATLAALRDGLWRAVNAAGTARRARVAGRDVAAKTGTAQVISTAGRAAAGDSGRDLRDHGWLVFFAPKDAPEIAGVIFGEHSEGGSRGGPIARHIVETYFAKKEGRPLPAFDSRPIASPTAPVLAAAPASPAAGDAAPTQPRPLPPDYEPDAVPVLPADVGPLPADAIPADAIPADAVPEPTEEEGGA